MAKTQKRSGGRRREKKNIPYGNVFIQATFNNTIVTVTDEDGNVFAWSSSGARGFKGAKKGTAYAAGIACETAVRRAMDAGLREVHVFSRGPGSGKEAAIRTIANLGVRIKKIKDLTPVPHNGCRPRGRRRV
ncbi:30S ribosomal protein S11 [bacterium]|nr:30S ribosomal protein S11 [bacterium]